MASYIEITESETDPGAPGTSELWKKWRDNPIAMFEGAPGAPRLKVGALERLTAGDQIRLRADTEVSAIGGGVVTLNLFQLMQAGTVRLSFEHRANTYASGSATVLRKRGDVSVQLASFANSTSYVERLVDCPVLPGDVLSITNTNPSYASFLRNCRLLTGGEDLFPSSLMAGAIEGNTYNA